MAVSVTIMTKPTSEKILTIPTSIFAMGSVRRRFGFRGYETAFAEAFEGEGFAVSTRPASVAANDGITSVAVAFEC
jgi:hypothetical protein